MYMYSVKKIKINIKILSLLSSVDGTFVSVSEYDVNYAKNCVTFNLNHYYKSFSKLSQSVFSFY